MICRLPTVNVGDVKDITIGGLERARIVVGWGIFGEVNLHHEISLS